MSLASSSQTTLVAAVRRQGLLEQVKMAVLGLILAAAAAMFIGLVLFVAFPVFVFLERSIIDLLVLALVDLADLLHLG